MLKLISFFVLSGIITINAADDNALKFFPEKPKPGEKVIVTYDAKNTPLKDKTKIDLYAFCYSLYGANQSDQRKEIVLVEMKKENEVWKATIDYSVNADIIGLLPVSGEDFDNNNNNGYFLKFYGPQGNETTESSLAYADAIGGNLLSNMMRFNNNDQKKSYEIMKEIFKTNPKYKIPLASSYLRLIKSIPGLNVDSLINTEVFPLIKDVGVNEEFLYYLKGYYKEKNDSLTAEQINKITLERFPIGITAVNLRAQELNAEKDYEKKIEIAFELDKKFADFFKKSIYNLSFTENILSRATEDKNQDVITKIYNRYLQLETPLSNFHSNITISKFIENNVALDIAFDWAKRYKNHLEKNYEDWHLMKNITPVSQRDIKWQQSKNQIKRSMALLHYLKGEKETAAKYFSEILPLEDFEWYPANTKNLIISCLVDSKKYDEAKTYLEKAITAGKADDNLKKRLKEVYVLQKGSDAGYDSYFSKLFGSSSEEVIKRYTAKLVNEKTPSMELFDLSGEKISLAQLKGKIVILDFWATWCGPCKASFPAMQKAVGKFSTDPNVVFLFINTFENVENKKKNAQNFLDKMKYNFHVLLDLDSKAAKDFGVTGIPTKIIIGKDGNIKFREVGSSAFEDELLNEITVMIELAKK